MQEAREGEKTTIFIHEPEGGNPYCDCDAVRAKFDADGIVYKTIIVPRASATDMPIPDGEDSNA